MMNNPNTNMELSRDGASLTVSVPFQVRRRGGRKVVISPGGSEPFSSRLPQTDTMLVRTIARAFRWQQLLDQGIYASARDLAAAEKLDRSFVCSVLRLTLLAPEVVERILDGKQPLDVQLPQLMRGVALEWYRQSAKFSF